MAGIARIGSGTAGRAVRLLSLVAIAALVPMAARADWRTYLSADFGLSTSKLNVDGSITGVGPALDFVGEDEDTSPLIGGAFGLSVPMDEILPREWLLDVRLPSWPVRIEIEGSGLREYEFTTVGPGAGAATFFSEIEVSTLFFNNWLDVPVQSIYSPIQYLFGLGRQPRVRRWLEPASLYLGAGVGVGFVDIRGTDNVDRISDGVIDFAWTAGSGLSYAITDRVTLAAGYRYVGIADSDLKILTNVATSPGDSIRVDQDIHEFRVTIRVDFLRFLSPWR